jgi:hypothetical protein
MVATGGRARARRWAAALVTAAVVVVAAACGGGDDNNNNGAAPGGTDAPADFSIEPETPGAATTTAPISSATAPASSSVAASVSPTSAPEPIAPGGSRQYTVSDGSQVMWGIAESGSPVTEPPAYPLKVSADKRYLEDQDGRPWRVQADAAWLISSEANPEQLAEYLDTRKAQGFNSFYLMAAVHPVGYGAAPHAPNDVNGDPPFAKPGDFSTAGATPASERYWTWIDTIIDEAAKRGMVVMLAYTYLGYLGGEQGWYADINAMPNRQSLHDWGVWLGKRYEDKPNIIWFGLGDYSPPAGSEGSLRAVAIAQGIKEAGAKQLFMAEPSNPDELPGEHPDFGPLVDMNSFYGYGPDGKGMVYVTAKRAWNFTPTKPGWMQEGTYEAENNSGHFSGEVWDTRRGRFWSVLAGGTAGDGFGSRQVWQWMDIPNSLHSPGAEQSTYAFDLFASMPWWELRPSGNDPGAAGRDLVTKGGGSWGDSDLITSAVTKDGSWLLAYVPVLEKGPRTFSVDMSALAGPSRARWFDPATGNYIAIAQALPNQGEQSFTTPGQRGDGTDDWVLVLDTNGTSPCGSISPSGAYTAPAGAVAGVTCEVTATKVGEPGVIARFPVTMPAG